MWCLKCCFGSGDNTELVSGSPKSSIREMRIVLRPSLSFFTGHCGGIQICFSVGEGDCIVLCVPIANKSNTSYQYCHCDKNPPLQTLRIAIAGRSRSFERLCGESERRCCDFDNDDQSGCGVQLSSDDRAEGGSQFLHSRTGAEDLRTVSGIRQLESL